MAQAPVQPEPVFGWRATLFAVVFLVAVLGGFGLATASAYNDAGHDDDHSEHTDDHGESHDEDSDDHSDE